MTPKLLSTVAAVRKWNAAHRAPVFLVPTMGALHAGHAALIRKARKLAGAGGKVVATIFVNPAQFGPKEDFSRYPRPFDADIAVCREAGADAIFCPSAAEMYPEGFSTWVNEESVSRFLCGAARQGHFRGVCTVVLKLFTICQPHTAVFGLKDYQQCQVIARMVRDLNFPVQLHFAPTIRERDGLALSSRNTYLTTEQRAQAPALRRGLTSARDAFRKKRTSADKLRAIIEKEIATTAPLGRVDYIEVVNRTTLEPIAQPARGDTIALAVFFGKTRLIDNVQL